MNPGPAPDGPALNDPALNDRALNDRGMAGDSAGMLARVLRDAGHEVVQLGVIPAARADAVRHIVDAAVQEDVDAIGLAGPAAGGIAGALRAALAERDAAEVRLFAVSSERSDDDVVCFTPDDLENAAAWVRSCAPTTQDT